MATFEEWNQGLLDFYFNPENKGSKIRFEVDKEFLDEEFYDLGGSAGFLKAVRIGPAHLKDFDHPNLAAKFIGLVQPWGDARKKKIDRLSPPTFMPYLVLFCYAWNIGDTELSLQNYFTRLDEVYPNHGLKILTKLHLYKKYGIFNRVSCWANSPQPDGMGGDIGFFIPVPIGRKSGIKWPQGQVIITDTRRARLGYLFNQMGIQPFCRESDIFDNESLINAIKGVENVAKWSLGLSNYKLIIEENSVILDQIREEIRNWDGSIKVLPSSGDGGGMRCEAGRLLLVLEKKGRMNPKLRALVAVENEFRVDGCVCLHKDNKIYRCSLGGGDFFREQNDLNWLSWKQITDEIYQGKWINEEENQEIELLLKHSNCNLKYLEIFGNCFIEKISPFLGGVVYLIVNMDSDLGRSWKAWVEEVKACVGDGVVCECKTQWEKGYELPEEFEFWYIDSWEKLTPALKDSAPSESACGSLSNSRAWLRGGLRVKSASGKPKTYFPFDPPQIVLSMVKGDETLEINNDDGILVDADSPSHLISDSNLGLPIQVQKVFDINLVSKKSLVSVKVMQENICINTINIHFNWKNTDIHMVSDGHFRLNKFGIPSNDSKGLAGSVLEPSLPFDVLEVTTFPKRFHRDHPVIKDKPYLPGDLLAWLAGNVLTSRRIPYGRVKSFFKKRKVSIGLSNEFSVKVHNELKALWQLGHIEIEIDVMGRYKNVYPLEACLYTLPVKDEKGRYQVALTGTYTKEQFLKIIELSRLQNDIEWVSVKQLGGGDYEKQYFFVPRLELFLAKDIGLLEDVAKNSNVKWQPSPPALAIAEWGGSLEEWKSNLVWLSDSRKLGPESYDPKQFKFYERADESDIKLLRSKDRITGQHYEHQLQKIAGHDISYAMIIQREWACWYCIVNENDRCSSFMYNSTTGSLLIPVGAELPLVLTRAFVLSSGHAPRYSLVSINEGNLMSNWKLDSGMYIEFDRIPKEIVCKVLTKVGANFDWLQN